VNTFIPVDKLETINLHDYHEVWLTMKEEWPQDPQTERECLWRADRELTTDVEIDEVYFQNLPRLWLRVDLEKQEKIDEVKKKLEARVKALGVEGEFFPGESRQTPCGDDVNKDLRS